jgi:uncharacterized protein (TIGR03437 family)
VHTILFLSLLLPSGILRQFHLAGFDGSGQNSIQAVAADSHGNIYVTGTTSSPDLAVKNAAQPGFGDARIMRTMDLGITWKPVGTPPRDVNSIVPDPTTSRVLFAGGDSGIYKSADGGVTWRLVLPFQSLYQFSGGLTIDPGNHLRVAAVEPFTGKIMRSVDGGESWSAGSLACSISNCQGLLLADPTGSGALLVSSFGLYLSRDWGLTFQTLQPPGQGTGSAASFDPSNRGWIYAASSAGVSGTLSLSRDFGATWVSKAVPPSNFSAIFSLAVDPDQPNALVAATPDALYRSLDGAVTWVRESSSGGSFLPQGRIPFAILGRRCAPAGGLVAAGGAGSASYAVAFSSDYGATWQTPRLTGVSSVSAAADCTVYATRTLTSDAFVSKVAPDGTVLWTTYLGGSDADAPVALAVDNQDNLYVAGNTNSPDFPSTVARIGVAGQDGVWVAKFSPEGRVLYAVVVGGEAHTMALAIAADANRNLYVAGRTNSAQFPVTPGTLPVSLAQFSYTGFLFKMSPVASLVYATYLGPAYIYPGALAVDAGEQVTIAGNSETAPAALIKLDRAASSVVASADLPGMGNPTALAVDGQGNLFLAGRADRGSGFVTPGAFVAPQPLSTCPAKFPTNGDVYVAKFSADWKPVYAALLRAACGIQPGALALDTSGAALLALSAGPGLPLRNPLLAGPACGANSSAIARLSPAGSSLEFATYLDNCGAPAIAVAGNGSTFAGVSPLFTEHAAALLHLPPVTTTAIALHTIANAFSGDAGAVAVGGLYSLTTAGLPLPALDLSLNPSQDLPVSLGGIEVQFDGVPAPIVQSAPGKLIVVAPLPPPAIRRNRMVPGFTAVRIVAPAVTSNTVWMPVTDSLPGLLTGAFLNPQPSASPDAYARNQDASVNDANHPAPAGSTLTLFVTGIGAAAPPLIPGTVAQSAASKAVTTVYATWKRYGNISVPPDPETVVSLPGYLSAVFQIPVLVPPVDILGGVPDANGVRRVVVGLQFAIAPSTSFPPASNLVAVYVR